MEKFTIAKDSMYNAWPDIAMTEKGELICVFTECEHHVDRRNSTIVIVRSSDRGRTWSKKIKISETSEDGKNYFNNPRIQKLKNGNMIILCDRIPSFETESEFGQTFLWNGGKEGVFNSSPIPIDVYGIVPDKILETAANEMIIASHHKDKASNKLVQYAYFSYDNGKTWCDKTVIAADHRYNLCEASLIEVKPNTIVAIMRENSFKGYDAMKAISVDGGHTFKGVYPIPIPGCHRPVSGFLKDGNIMISCRYLQGGGHGVGSFQNAQLVFLDRDTLLETNRDKQVLRIFPLDYDRNPHSDVGYTGWVQFENGELYVVNYIMDDWNKAQIRGYSVLESDYILHF